MSVKAAAGAQYQRLVDQAVPLADGLQTPAEGWIRTVRKALGMSGPQLAKRLGVSRARISTLELSELDGAVSLKTIGEAAEAMGCRLVYAVVPETTVARVVEQQARKKATALVRRSSTHMALEDQSLTKAARGAELTRITQDILAHRPPDFWEEA
jgi:predicted DNA-binding mobile mystery protein A